MPAARDVDIPLITVPFGRGHVAACDCNAVNLLTGDDVISSLGLGAGPSIGDILRQAAQLERDGILQNRKAALLWLRNLAHNA